MSINRLFYYKKCDPWAAIFLDTMTVCLCPIHLSNKFDIPLSNKSRSRLTKPKETFNKSNK